MSDKTSGFSDHILANLDGLLPDLETMLKTIALMRKLRHRGVCKVDWIFTFACAAYNLVRMRNLAAAVPAV